MHQILAKLFFLGRRKAGIAKWMDDASALNDPIGPNHLCDRRHRGHLSDRDPRAL